MGEGGPRTSKKKKVQPASSAPPEKLRSLRGERKRRGKKEKGLGGKELGKNTVQGTPEKRMSAKKLGPAMCKVGGKRERIVHVALRIKKGAKQRGGSGGGLMQAQVMAQKATRARSGVPLRKKGPGEGGK